MDQQRLDLHVLVGVCRLGTGSVVVGAVGTIARACLDLITGVHLEFHGHTVAGDIQLGVDAVLGVGAGWVFLESIIIVLLLSAV